MGYEKDILTILRINSNSHRNSNHPRCYLYFFTLHHTYYLIDNFRKRRAKSEELIVKSKIDKLLSKLVDFWQGWQDSNLRMPESKSGALPAWLHPRIKFIGLTVTRETVCNYRIIRRRCQANEKLFNNFEQFSEIKRLDARQDFTQAFGALLSEPVSTFRLNAIVKFYRTNYLFSFIERKLLL